MKKITSLFLGLMLVSNLSFAVELEEKVSIEKIDKRISELKQQREAAAKQLDSLTSSVHALTGAIMILEEIKIKQEEKTEEVKK